MTMNNIEAFEKRLWGAADQLRANSGLGSNEYFLPVLGILFQTSIRAIFVNHNLFVSHSIFQSSCFPYRFTPSGSK